MACGIAHAERRTNSEGSLGPAMFCDATNVLFVLAGLHHTQYDADAISCICHSARLGECFEQVVAFAEGSGSASMSPENGCGEIHAFPS